MTHNQSLPGGLAVISFFIISFAIMVYCATWAFLSRGYGVLYPLDDSYIHLAIAKTLAESGVWGIAPTYPSAASSSPLWTVLLAATAVLLPGMDRSTFTWVPLILNAAAAVILVGFWWRRLQATTSPIFATCVLIAIMPLPAIALIGMEHVLHTLLASMLAWSAAEMLEKREVGSDHDIAILAILAALAVAARYESLALIATIGLLAIFYRRWRLVPAVVLPAVLVIAGFAALWVSAGGWALPNALLLKTGLGAEQSGVFGFLRQAAGNVSRGNMHLIVLAAVVALLWFMLRRHNGPERAFLVLALSCNVAQFLFGMLGWLYRYEAWLVALNGLAIILAANVVLDGRRVAFFGVILAVLSIEAPRAIHSITRTIAAADDRAWQHFEPAAVLVPYAGEVVLVNDIGVIAYHGRNVSLDVYGLANNEVLKMKRTGNFDSDHLRALAVKEHAHVGEFQICWPAVSNALPSEWKLVEVWSGPRNVVFTDRTTAFMADNEVSAERLRSILSAARIRGDIRRFDASSGLVRDYNNATNKKSATQTLCMEAPRQAAALHGIKASSSAS